MDRTLDELNRAVMEAIPDIAELWFHPDAEGVVDLRLRIEPDSWDAREHVIDSMLELRRKYIDRVSINYSFTLPDVAFEAPERAAVQAGNRVREFAAS